MRTLLMAAFPSVATLGWRQSKLRSAPAHQQVHHVQDLVFVIGREETSNLAEILQQEVAVDTVVKELLAHSAQPVEAMDGLDWGELLVPPLNAHGSPPPPEPAVPRRYPWYSPKGI